MRTRKNARPAYHCTCGAMVYSSAGRATHRAWHKRRLERHRFLALSSWARAAPPEAG